MKSQLNLKTVAVLTALVLASSGTAQAAPKCLGLVRAFNAANDQIKAGTQKWRAASIRLLTFYKQGERDIGKTSNAMGRFTSEFNTLGNQVATTLGATFNATTDGTTITDSSVTIGPLGGASGGTVPGAGMYLGFLYHPETAGTEADPTYTGAYVSPLNSATNVTEAAPALGNPSQNVKAWLDFYCADPTNPGLSPTQITKILHCRSIALQKLLVSQAKIRLRTTALNKYVHARFHLIAARVAQETRLQANLRAATTTLFGAAANSGTPPANEDPAQDLYITDPTDHGLTRVYAATNSLWGARNVLYTGTTGHQGLNQCDSTRFPLFDANGSSTGAGPFLYAP
jgi:hypothetical protein